MRKITKRAVLWVVILGAVSTLKSQSVGTGRVVARFGVDGDLSSDTSLNGGGALGTIVKPSDDWFYCPNVKNHQGGFGVIDTTKTDSLKLLMQGASAWNWTFAKGMAVPKLTRSGNYILLDALYTKDYFGTDATSITGPGGVKVLDDPSTWLIGSSSMTSKADVLEFYSHVRRKGQTVRDSLFFYYGVGMDKTSGAKNVAAELFVNDVSLSGGALINLGSQGGRVAWRLSNTGKVVVIGDMIINMAYTSSGGGSYSIVPHIWLRRSTYDSFTQTSGPLAGLRPANFNFGNFDAQGPGATDFGYAELVPKVSTQNIGEGTSNAVSSCLAAPWGTYNSSGVFSTQYDANQFIEFSANLTAMGVDPSLFEGIDPCTVPYRSIIFYSTSSPSPSSSPQDFAGPYPFWRYPRIPNILSGGHTLTCNNPSVSLTADSAYSLAYYKWTRTPIGGGSEDSVGIGTSFNATLPGVYKLKSAPLQGCYEIESTVTIYEDKVAPVATLSTSTTWEQGTGIDTFDILDGDPSYYFIKLYAGNLSSSVSAYNGISGVPGTISLVTPDSFKWQLTRYNGGANTLVNDTTLLTNIFNGDYYTFRLTGLRNGCFASQKILITQLPVNIMNFNCRAAGDMVQLNWSAADEQGLKYYEIQRTENGSFKTIGRINASENPFVVNKYTFRDNNPLRGWNSYRLRMVMENGNSEYSTICMSSYGDNMLNGGISVVPNPAASHLGVMVGFSEEFPEVKWRMVNTSGAEVMNGTALINAGAFSLDVSKLPAGVYSLEVYNQSQLVTSKVMINK